MITCELDYYGAKAALYQLMFYNDLMMSLFMIDVYENFAKSGIRLTF